MAALRFHPAVVAPKDEDLQCIAPLAHEEAQPHGRGEIALAREDATRFFDALSDPPPPNDRLRAALEEHARRVDSR